MDGQDITNFTINEKDFENLYNFSIKSKLRMIFDLNVLIRNINGSWNDINAKNIISFAKNKNMKIDWQLGNGNVIILFFIYFLFIPYFLNRLINNDKISRTKFFQSCI